MSRSVLLPIIIKTVLPSALTAFGTVMAVLWNDGFLAFCGVQ